MPRQTKRITVIGGGTGSYTVLSGLKRYVDDGISLSAVVSMSDSGGSTGRLRDEFGYLPVGDVRMALAALAESGNGDNLLRDLFLYRFNKGTGLRGHNFGNLLLVAMTDLLGSEKEAISFAGQVLRIRGQVIPVTTKNVTLSAKYEDGSLLKGESTIDEPPRIHDGTKRIERIWLDPYPSATPEALRAVRGSNLIVLGPGDLYTSILPNLIVKGVSEALRSSKGKIALVVNLMSKYGQTHGFKATDFVKEVEKYAGRAPDIVLLNSTELPADMLRKYRRQREFPIQDDLGSARGIKIIRRDLLAPEKIRRASGDVRRISFLRHDSHKLARELTRLLR